MRDIVLEETIYLDFTTRSFTTGVPTVLSGTPALSVLEENNITPITAGVSVSVDRASVVGLNMATIVATAANGYENGKGYSVYISTGTVGGVSVVGEKVAEFTVGASAAAQDLANGTDGLGAIKADTATTLIDTADMQPKVAKIPLSDGTITWNSTALASVNAECDTALTDYDGPTNAEMVARTLVSAGYFDPATDTVATVTTVTGGATSAAQTTAQNDLDIITGATGVNLLAATQSKIDAIPTTAMRGTDSANTVAPDNAGITAIKAKTDSLTFTVTNKVDSNVKSVNDITVTGTGAEGDEWGP